MRKFLSIVLIMLLSGCASVNIPKYIQDKHPYKRTFYASYDDVLAQVIESLDAQGWKVKEQSDPALFERSRSTESNTRPQTLLFTEMREFSFFLGSRYSRLNVFLYVAADKATEVEIRTVKILSMPFKSFNNYKNDSAIERIFVHIEEGLNL